MGTDASPAAPRRRRGDDLPQGDDARRVLGELAIRAAGIGTFDWDLVTGRLAWDDQLLDLFGYDRSSFDETIEGFSARVHPADQPRVSAALASAIDTCGEYEAEYRVVAPDRPVRWVAARGRALADGTGRAVRVLGAAYDRTAVHDSEARVARVLEATPTAFYSLDHAWRFTYVNAEAERLLGTAREALLGRVVWDLFPAALDSAFEEKYRRALAEQRPVVFDAYYPAPLDGWFELHAWPSPDGLSVHFFDITARRAAQEEAERTAERASLLAEVTAALTGTLDAEEAVARLAQLVVPALGDWCVVTLVDDDHADLRRGLRDIGWWHADPAQRPLVERYANLRLDALEPRSFVAQALQSGEPAHVEEGATRAVRSVLKPGEARDLLDRLAPEAVVVLPLRGRGRTVGLLSLFAGAERVPMSPADIATAQDVAGRAGLALDNSRLYRQQRRLAEGLQRSLLTPPPEPDHMQVVVRYVPAAEAAQIGGDWYDAFLQRDGATVLVIGDVVGHDTAAAAAMGQVRSILRGIAVATGAGPAQLLREVDQAMRTLQATTIATAVVARIEQTPEDLAHLRTRVRWSNAGHPPPLVIRPDGTVVPLVAAQGDLLLGVLPDTLRRETEVVLDAGSTVLLFTDGLVERRAQPLRAGLTRLQQVLSELARLDLDLDALCDETLRRMLPPHPEDDVALVAVRLHPQVGPRPPEAGPNRVPPDVPPAPEAPAGTAGAAGAEGERP
ncbi:SpoIIE family protein phosphatase [Actinotalea subterranea]|uniref:SpoIIE family protein phosphatase n=1 Tax=Actinotalea subterranea TaxID=2607497 RepID=UPI001FEBD64E|nr:SpoIIE family protein phosphatase [Actinotalea subterranea]